MRAAVFRHVQDLPPHFFQQHRQGDLVERLTGDVESIEQLMVSGVVGAVSAAFSAVFHATAAFWLRWDLAPATFVLAPLLLLAARRFSGRIEQAARDGRVADGAITSVVEESLGNVVLTQAYNSQRDEEKRLDREARAWLRASVRGARLGELYEQFVEVVETLRVLAVIGLGVPEISAGRMPLGQLLAFAAFLSGCTTLVITHDLSLAPDADRVLVVDHGRLVETGTHQELLARGGVYARLAQPLPEAVAAPAPTGDDTLILRR